MASQRDRSGINSLSSRPRAVEEHSKYRSPSENTCPKYGNIMIDRRVVRGNTYSHYFRPPTAVPHPAEIKRKQPAKKKEDDVRRQAKENQVRFTTPEPEPVQGRKHMDVQTDLYLEELSCVIVVTDMTSQTDPLMDKPASPLFIPVKSGTDVGTQIEEGELFEFDLEVEPILEVLVGKTVEQALLEVMEEEELAFLRAQQRKFQVLRDMELAEVQRLQEQDRRRSEERERRITQQREALAIEKETVEKIAARAYTQQSLANLLPMVFNSLRMDGYFPDPVERDIETDYMAWQMEEVHNNLDTRNRARQLLDQIILDVVEKRMEAFGIPKTEEPELEEPKTEEPELEEPKTEGPELEEPETEESETEEQEKEEPETEESETEEREKEEPETEESETDEPETEEAETDEPETPPT